MTVPYLFGIDPAWFFGINRASAMIPFGLFNQLPRLHKLTLDAPRLYLNSLRDEVCIRFHKTYHKNIFLSIDVFSMIFKVLLNWVFINTNIVV